MKQYDKEIMQAQLDNEKAVLKALEQNYQDALEEINSKIAYLMGRADADMQHVIYQVEYQKALKKQIEGILLQLQTNEFETISEYLTKSYEEGFLGTMYSMQSQGVPLVFPINQEEIVAAIQHETNLTSSLYNALDIKDLQKKIAAEISRGFSTGALYRDVARNVSAVTGLGKNKAMTIARTEGHRITEAAAYSAQKKAKDRGADVVKIWDSILDSKTRPSHVRVDGEIRELEKKYSNGLMYPGDPSGAAAEVINCRCRSRTEARWALDAAQTKMLGDTSKMTDEQKKAIAKKLGIPVEDLDLYSGQIVPINAKNYADFKKQYDKLWHYEGSELQKQAEARIAKLEKAKRAKKNVRQEGGRAKAPQQYEGVFDDFSELNISGEEKKAINNLRELTKSSGFEYGAVIENGVVKSAVTSNLNNAVQIPLGEYGDNLTVLHSHTNDTLPSITDFQLLLNKKVEKIGVVSYNGDVFMAYVGNGWIPDLDEFREEASSIRSAVNMDIMDDPNFFEWSVEERTYMAIREQAYRLALHFGWTLEGGKLDG